MESLFAALLDGNVGTGIGPRLERLLRVPASDVVAAIRTFVMSIFQPRNVAAAGGLGAMLAAILSYRWWKYAALGLFTRILPPRVLDQATRARIFEFIENRPGARAHYIVKDVGLATGQAMHHLYVLERQGFITRTGGPLGKRYFVKGRFSPKDMQNAIVDQTEPLARLRAVVETQPGATIHELATALELSSARVSRMTQQLAQVGILERVVQGRVTRVYAKAR